MDPLVFQNLMNQLGRFDDTLDIEENLLLLNSMRDEVRLATSNNLLAPTTRVFYNGHPRTTTTTTTTSTSSAPPTTSTTVINSAPIRMTTRRSPPYSQYRVRNALEFFESRALNERMTTSTAPTTSSTTTTTTTTTTTATTQTGRVRGIVRGIQGNSNNNINNNNDYSNRNDANRNPAPSSSSNRTSNNNNNNNNNGNDAGRNDAPSPSLSLSSNRTHLYQSINRDFMRVAGSLSSRHNSDNCVDDSNIDISTNTGNEPNRSTNESLDEWTKAAKKNSKLRQKRGREAAPIMVATQPQIDSNPDGCSICLENFKLGDMVRLLPCLHLFHAGTDMEGTSVCIDGCFDAGTTLCPVCRAQIVAFEDRPTPMKRAKNW